MLRTIALIFLKVHNSLTLTSSSMINVIQNIEVCPSPNNKKLQGYISNFHTYEAMEEDDSYKSMQ